jgi:hypothetical protein
MHLNTPELVSPLLNEFLLKDFGASSDSGAPGASEQGPPFDLV